MAPALNEREERKAMTTPEPPEPTQPGNIATPRRLDDWSCFEVLQAQRTERSHHIVGSICQLGDAIESREGCVTSAIVSVDPAKRLVLTESGDTFELGRCSAMTPDAFYVWRRWQRATQATNVLEVTADINNALRKDSPADSAPAG